MVFEIASILVLIRISMLLAIVAVITIELFINGLLLLMDAFCKYVICIQNGYQICFKYCMVHISLIIKTIIEVFRDASKYKYVRQKRNYMFDNLFSRKVLKGLIRHNHCPSGITINVRKLKNY